jgi:hypothetical protein
MAEAKIPVESVEAGHELRDLSPKAIALFALSLATLLVLVVLVTSFLHEHYLRVQVRTQAPPSPFSAARAPTPEPRLAVTPGEQIKALRAAEDSLLKSYAWVDRQQGIVRIPIDRAMELLAQRGLPTRAQKGQKTQNRESSEGRLQ